MVHANNTKSFLTLVTCLHLQHINCFLLYLQLNVLGDRKFENPQTASLSRVLSENYEISQLLSSMKSSPMTTVELDVSFGIEILLVCGDFNPLMPNG